MNRDALIEQLINFANEVHNLCAMNKRKSRHSTLNSLLLLSESG